MPCNRGVSSGESDQLSLAPELSEDVVDIAVDVAMDIAVDMAVDIAVLVFFSASPGPVVIVCRYSGRTNRSIVIEKTSVPSF